MHFSEDRIPGFQAPMPSFLEVTNALRNKLADPRNCLLNKPPLNNKMTLFKDSIVSVLRMSKYVYIVCTPHPIYVSTVFNRNFSFIKSDFRLVAARRCLDHIYYDLEIE